MIGPLWLFPEDRTLVLAFHLELVPRSPARNEPERRRTIPADNEVRAERLRVEPRVVEGRAGVDL